MGEVIIRRYKDEDRSAVRKIACDTAFMGEPAEVFFDDREILADFLTAYFTDYEPESCFVADFNAQVSGYLLGARDTAILEKVFLANVLPKILRKLILSRNLLNRKNIIFMCRLLISLIRGELRTPDFSKDYPALLHINIVKDLRSQGIGSKLIAGYLSYLENQKIPGVHLATMSEQAPFFFKQNGFELVYSSKRSYFKNILHRDINCYIYAKKLQTK